jgi:O-antigen/teichoic acid export membrane protein
VSTLLLWLLSPWRPRFLFSLTSLRDLGAFGGSIFGQRLLYYVTRTADNMLIGRFLGPAAVGAYALSYNVMLIPLSRLSVPVAEVMFPALSRLQDERGRVGAMWLRVNRTVAAISVPALLGLVVVAPDFVHVVLGDRWRAATSMIQILAWVGILQAIQNLNGEILQALNRAGMALGFTALWSVSNIAAFVVGLRWGIVGVAAAFAISSTLLAPVSIGLTGRVAGVSLRGFGRNLMGVAQASALMAAGVAGARLLLVHAGVPPAARLVLLILVGIVLYLPLIAWRMPEVVADARSLRSRATA